MTNLDQFKRAPQGSFNLQRKLLAATVAACFGVAQANPTLPQVVAGQATFAQQGNVFSITNTPNTIINWQSFSVGRDEITRFIQQSQDSKVLNRITGQDPSQILGSLQSNGQVFLINPNGVLFGKDARIDVHGLVASSLQLSNADFLAGKQNFNGAAGAGKVVNQGSITTPQGGKVFLIAPTVENHGVISAPNGEILLAAGKSVQLVDSADPAITVVLSAPDDQALNLGQIVAQGGRVGIYGALVSQRGVVNANSAVRGENGKIILKASRNTQLEAGSQTTASGAGKGGEIQILGQNVALNGNAQVDASGRQGGGTVLIGGDYQGANSAVQNARQTFIGKNAVIRADAEVSGDGGKVIVWADESARAYGAISARSAGGKGGFIETSGHYLDVAGLRIDASGTDQNGVWLLDPYNIEVVSSSYGAYGLSDVANYEGGLGGNTTTQILTSTLNNASADVVLLAKNNITFKNSVSMLNEGVGLTAQAGNDIYVNAGLATNGGNISLLANHNGAGTASGNGTVEVNAALSSGNGNISLNGARITVNAAVTATPDGIKTGDNAPLISLRADDVSFGVNGALANTANGGGFVAIATRSSGREIRIDNDSVGGAYLGLSTAELGSISAYEINVGDANTGKVSVNANTTVAAKLVLEGTADIAINSNINVGSNDLYVHSFNPAGKINLAGNLTAAAGKVTLQAAGGITQGSGGIVADQLTIDAAGANVSLQSFQNDVNTLDAAAQNLSFYGKGNLTIGALTQGSAAKPSGNTSISLIDNGAVLTVEQARGYGFLQMSAPVLRTEGALKAEGMWLDAGAFDITGTSSLDGGAQNVTFAPREGKLQLNGTSTDPAVTVFNTAALANVLSSRVQFDAYDGITVAGDVETSKHLVLTSFQNKVKIDAVLDAGDTGTISLQGRSVEVNARVHAGEISIAPMRRITDDIPYSASMVIGGTCDSSIDCMSINYLANLDAASVVLGDSYNTSTMLVKGISASGATARHAKTKSITLRANNGITQEGAIDVDELWAGTNFATVLDNAANRVNVLGADINGGMTTKSLTFNNSGNLVLDAGRITDTIKLTVNGNLTTGDYTLVAGKLEVHATGAVGTDERPLFTQVGRLNVETTGVGKSISIMNNYGEPGALTIERLVVANTSTGGITLSNYGATTIAGTEDALGNVRSGSGAISITAHSPLTVNGKVMSKTGAIALEAGVSSTPANDVLTISGSGARVETGGAVRLKGGSTVSYSATQVKGSSLTVNGSVVNPPPSNPPPVDPPPVDPPPVNPPPVNPPPVDPPPVNPPPVNPPPVNPPPVDPPPVNPPPVNPPPVNPPPVNPPPSADICTVAPNSALCQVLSPPTASEPVKPVERAVTEVIKVINTAQSDAAPGSSGSSGSSSAGKSSASGPVKADGAKEEKKEEKSEEKKDVSDKSANKEPANEKPAAKTFCN